MQIFLKIEHVLVITTYNLDYEYIKAISKYVSLSKLYIGNVPRSTII